LILLLDLKPQKLCGQPFEGRSVGLLAFHQGVDPGGVQHAVKLIDLIVLAQPLEVVVVGVKYFDLAFVSEQFPQKLYHFPIDSIKLVDDEHFFHGGYLYETNKRLVTGRIVFNVYAYQPPL
jgi:hypothetical protein